MSLEEVQTALVELLKVVVSICETHRLNYFLCSGSALGAHRHKGIIPWDHDIDIGIPYDELELMISIMKTELKEPYYINCYEINNSYYRLGPRFCIRGINSIDLHIDVFPHIGLSNDKKQQLAVYNRLHELNYQFALKQQRPYRTEGSIRRKINKAKQTVHKCLLFRSAESIYNEYVQLCKEISFNEAEYIVNSCWQYSFDCEVMKRSIVGDCIKGQFSGIDVQIPADIDGYLTLMYGDYMAPPPDTLIRALMQYKLRVEPNMPDAYR